ncbi:MAG: hypothetical protein ACYCSF_13685 [Acidimicrobiales bacterium]
MTDRAKDADDGEHGRDRFPGESSRFERDVSVKGDGREGDGDCGLERVDDPK